MDGRDLSANHVRTQVAVAVLLLVCLSLALGACTGPLDGARALEKSGDLEGARSAYNEILAEEPENLEALTALAVVLLQLRRYDQALPVQEKVVALDPKDALTRVELAFNYLNHQQLASKAVQYLAEAVELEPSAKNLTFLAQAQIEDGDASGAESSLRQALLTDHQYPYAHVVLVGLLEDQGRSREASAVRRAAAEAGVELD